MEHLQSGEEITEQKFRRIFTLRKKMKMWKTEDRLLIVINCRKKLFWDDLCDIGKCIADLINSKFKNFPRKTEIFLLSRRFEIDKEVCPPKRNWRGVLISYNPFGYDTEESKKWFALSLFYKTKHDIERAEGKGRLFKWEEI